MHHYYNDRSTNHHHHDNYHHNRSAHYYYHHNDHDDRSLAMAFADRMDEALDGAALHFKTDVKNAFTTFFTSLDTEMDQYALPAAVQIGVEDRLVEMARYIRSEMKEQRTTTTTTTTT